MLLCQQPGWSPALKPLQLAVEVVASCDGCCWVDWAEWWATQYCNVEIRAAPGLAWRQHWSSVLADRPDPTVLCPQGQ